MKQAYTYELFELPLFENKVGDAENLHVVSYVECVLLNSKLLIRVFLCDWV